MYQRNAAKNFWRGPKNYYHNSTPIKIIIYINITIPYIMDADELCRKLTEYSKYENVNVRRAVAGSNNLHNIPEECAYEILSRLSEDDDEGVRWDVARNEDIPEHCACEILTRLSNDDAWGVRLVVAGNKSIPEDCACDILTKLSRDKKNVYLRREVARNPNIPKDCACDIFTRLSEDDDEYVREGVARNPLYAKCR